MVGSSKKVVVAKKKLRPLGEASLDFEDEVKRRAWLSELASLLVAGMTDEQARYEMGISYADYDRLKATLYERETGRLRKSSAHDIFIDYAFGQQSVLQGVDALLEKIEESKQFSAAVGALRLASDIRHRILTTGQDLGVLAKRPEEKRVFNISGSIEDMRAMVAKEVKAIDAMMKSASGKDLLAIDVGPIYRDPPAALDAAAPSTKGKTTSHHGRRVVKEGLKPS